VTTASGDGGRPGRPEVVGCQAADDAEGLVGARHPDGFARAKVINSGVEWPEDVRVSAEQSCAAALVDLTGLAEADARQALAGQTARFAAGFLRWIDSRAGSGMSYVRLRLLQALHCHGPAIMRDLGTELGASPRNMTALVDALEDASLVVRRPHPTDRRATLIELSPAGVREAEQSLGDHLDTLSAIFAELSAAEREQFSAAMTKLMQAMRERGQAC
jgi:DNA-binding MarR family transcriptional regulator